MSSNCKQIHNQTKYIQKVNKIMLLGCLGFEVPFYNTLVNQKHNEESNIDALSFPYFNANVFAITL